MVVDYLWVFRYRNQTLHDLAAETIIVSWSGRAVPAAPAAEPTLTSLPDSARPGKALALITGLIDFVIIVATLGVGWLVWLNFTAPNSQTPGGQLTGLRLYHLDGQPASGARVTARAAYELMIGIGLGLITAGIVTLVDYLWVLRGDDRQALHDVAAKTILVRVNDSPETGVGDEPLGDSAREPAGQAGGGNPGENR